MSALDDLNVRRLVCLIRTEIQNALYANPNSIEAQAETVRQHLLEQVQDLKARYPGELEVVSSHSLHNWTMRRNGHLDFFDRYGQLVQYKQPRVRSRRLRRIWACNHVGLVLMSIRIKPPMHVNNIVLNFVVGDNL